MAKIKKIKDKNGTLHELGDAAVAAYESTLTTSTANVPYSSAVSTAISTAVSGHADLKTNPHEVTAAQVGLGNVENKSAATILGELTGEQIVTKLGYTPMDASIKGKENGVAELDATGKVPATQLPSYVDDVIEGYKDGNKFYKESTKTTEIPGETGKIYVDLNTNKTYRWSGSQFTEISESLALGETSSTAFRGDYGKTAYDHSQISGDSTVHHTHSNKSVLDGISADDITAWNAKQPAGNYKTTQTAVTDPTADGNSITFIDTISQNTNGVITVTKKTVQTATTAQNGVMTSDMVTKLSGIQAGATKVETSTTNGKIKINGTESTVYTHPTATATDAAAVKVGKDALGHVTLGDALTKSDVGLGNVENKSSETIRSEITSENVTSALGYTPINPENLGGLYVAADTDGTYYVAFGEEPKA